MQVSPECVKSTMPEWIRCWIQVFLLHDDPDPLPEEETIEEFQRCWEQWAKALNQRQVFADRICESVGDIVRAGPCKWTPAAVKMMRWLWDQGGRLVDEGEWRQWTNECDRAHRIGCTHPSVEAGVNSMQAIIEGKRASLS